MSEQSEPIASNRRVAKNALMMTIRMVIATLVGLYTSRVVFNVLGVEDYGIYGAVGGIVGMMSFLNAAMSGATSRFLTFELGRGDRQRLADTFSSTFIAHCIIAAIVLIAAEIVGVWLLNTRMNIPPDRLYAANWVLQFSIIATIIGITQTPYNACLIAHERMSVFAYFEIANVTLKLLIVYLLSIGNADKLILYSALILAVGILMQLAYHIYCVRHFNECHIRWRWQADIIKPILKFSGLDIYGNLCVTASSQGRTIIINIFFGVVCNAAAAVGQTVQGIASSLAYNITTAFRPQIIKLYASGDIERMQLAMRNAAVFSLLLLSAIVVPCFLEADYVLALWLGTPPPMASTFLKILLTVSIVGMINNILNIAIHATGNIKRISYISGSVFLISPLFIYVAFKMGLGAQFAFIIELLTRTIVAAYGLYVVKRQIPAFRLRAYAITLVKIAITIALACAVPVVIHQHLQSSLIRACLVTALYLITAVGLFWLLIFDKESKSLLIAKIKHICKR
ncbi:MAG: polysaccharide biosynthesis protein [Muribaculaceae bacterium]